MADFNLIDSLNQLEIRCHFSLRCVWFLIDLNRLFDLTDLADLIFTAKVLLYVVHYFNSKLHVFWIIKEAEISDLWDNALVYPYFIFVASTEEELKKTRKERDDIRREKDEIIAELQFKIDHMESAYESVLHVCIRGKEYLSREIRQQCWGGS